MCTASNTCLLWRTESHPKRHIDRFSCSYIAHDRESLYFTMGAPSFPQNCPFALLLLDPIQHVVPLAHPSPQPKGYLDRFSRFCRVQGRDRQTDHATPSVAIGRIFVVQRCGLIIVVSCADLGLSAFDLYSHTAVWASFMIMICCVGTVKLCHNFVCYQYKILLCYVLHNIRYFTIKIDEMSCFPADYIRP